MTSKDDLLATIMKDVHDVHMHDDNKYIKHAIRFTNNFRVHFDPTKIFFQ